MKNIIQRHLVFYQLAAFLVFAAYGFFIALGSNPNFPSGLNTNSWMPHLFDKPVGEDGYYMLMVAWNLSEGKWFVANFDQNVTGIQPLATVLFATIASIVKFFNGEKVEFIRAVLIFGTLNTIVFAYLIARLTRKLNTDDSCAEIASFFAAVITCSSYYIYRLFTYGLETGIYLVCLVILLMQYLKVKEEYTLEKNFISKNVIFFGILVGITGLARIDFGVLFAILIIYNVINNQALIFPLLIAGIIGAIVVSPWIIYIYFVTGTPIPSSGPAQASLVSLNVLQGRVLDMYSAFIQNFMPTIFVGGKWYTLFTATILLIGIILMDVKRGVFKRIGGLTDWLAPLLSLLPIYITFFWATHFYARYTAPLLVLGIPFSALSLALFLKRMNNTKYTKVIAVGAIGSFLTFSIMSLHRGAVGNAHVVTAGYIAKFKPNEIVGAFQSGVIGFVNTKVVNLDGKVNFKVLSHIKSGNIDSYLQENLQIKIIIDWPGYIENFISTEYLETNWKLCIDGSSWGSVGYCRREP